MFDLPRAARLAIGLLDLTSLNDDDSEQDVLELCRRARTPLGEVAAVCIYPRFIPVARRALERQGSGGIRIATVVNFPQGGDSVESAAEETRAAVQSGADEVDVVFPYRALLAGRPWVGLELVRACKAACGENALLKVILETGELKGSEQSPELKPAELIRAAADIAIDGGADFIKTSTGKVPVNATLEAAEIMLETIAARNRQAGFKAAGGIRDAEEARQYLELAARILGAEWITPRHFRFGASTLLDSLLVAAKI